MNPKPDESFGRTVDGQSGLLLHIQSKILCVGGPLDGEPIHDHAAYGTWDRHGRSKVPASRYLRVRMADGRLGWYERKSLDGKEIWEWQNPSLPSGAASVLPLHWTPHPERHEDQDR